MEEKEMKVATLEENYEALKAAVKLDDMYLICEIIENRKKLKNYVHTPPHHSSESVEEAAKKVWDLLGGEYYIDRPDDTVYAMINHCRDLLRTTVIEPLAGASFQSLQGKASKTLDECKDLVARKYLYNSFEDALQYHMDEFNPSFALKKSLTDLFDEAYTLYYTQT